MNIKSKLKEDIKSFSNAEMFQPDKYYIALDAKLAYARELLAAIEDDSRPAGEGFFTEPGSSAEERAAEWKGCALVKNAELMRINSAILDAWRKTRGDGGFPDEDGLTPATLTDKEAVQLVESIAGSMVRTSTLLQRLIQETT
jgi:hypothetical protein